MPLKRISVRFNLDDEEDRKAWESLQSAGDSKKKAIVTAINSYFGNVNPLIAAVRETIQDCLSGMSVVQGGPNPEPEKLTEAETNLMGILNSFIGKP